MATAIKYSNGYRLDDVLGALMNRTRWRQPTRSDFPMTLSGDNIWAAGDNYSPVFDAVHKAVTPYNIWITQEDTSITSSNFNQLLQNLQIDAIIKVLKGVLNKKEWLEKKLMFERFGRTDYVNPNTGVFVGVRITPAKEFDVTCQIDNVALKFDSNVTFNLYLFHDTQPTVPVATIPVTAVANQQVVIPIDQMLSYANDGHKSGCYYLGYFQSDLGSAQGINEIIQNFNTCNYFGMVPIELPVVGSNGINVNNVSFTIKTHGFNLQMSAFRDYTQMIVDNAYLFDNLIGLQVAADVIEMIQNNTRTNKDQRITKEMTSQLYSDLNVAQSTDQMPFSVGLKTRIQREAERVKKELFPKPKVYSITHDTDEANIYGTPPPMIDVFKY